MLAIFFFLLYGDIPLMLKVCSILLKGYDSVDLRSFCWYV